MEMIIKEGTVRRQLFAVVIFFGMGATTLGQAAVQTEDGSSKGTLTNTLHFAETNGTFTLTNDIFLTDSDAIGIRVGGWKNYVKVLRGTTIRSDGLNGKGLFLAEGNGHIVRVDGNIFAAGNAVEFNAEASNFPLVNEFNLSGKLQGDNAIYIGKNSFVKDINIDAGAEISGNIISDWNAANRLNPFLTSETAVIEFDGKIFDATKFNPDLVTNLNFNGDLTYGGNIFGANNLNMRINAGTLKFSGAANVVGVVVNGGSKIFGGTFTLNNMSARLAEGVIDTSTGKFVNHGTIGAFSPDTNLIINGDLISDGFLQKVSGGNAGSIIVHGTANVDGSTVTTDTLLPNETATVLIADNAIVGNIKNPAGNPVPISALLSATGEIVGNTLTVTTYAANNFDYLNSQEKQTLDAMDNMLKTLDGEQQDEMRSLYNLKPDETKKTLTQIGANDSAQIMSVAQQNTAVDRMIADRITQIFTPDYIDLSISPMNFADDNDAPEVEVKVKVPARHDNNFWLNYTKNWGSLRGGTDYHGTAIIGGYDRPFGKKWRAGIFATYGTIGYGADSSRATVHDTRLGLYAGYHNRQSDVYFYVNGGQLRNSLHRGISSLGLSTHANYHGQIIEVGGEYKYDLQPRRKWHVAPFINVQTSYLRQDSYNEQGAGIYNQHVAANSNTYLATQAGLDLKRYYRRGMFGTRFGVKQGFTGADPELRITYEGDGSRSYRLRQKRDKTHFVFSLRGENEFARGWFIGGETELQLGENDRDVTASVMLRRMW